MLFTTIRLTCAYSIMCLAQFFVKDSAKLERDFSIKMLAKLSSEYLTFLSQKKVLKAFQRAAAMVPAYQHALKEKGIKAEDIQNLHTFLTKVPFLDKHNTFAKYEMKDLCAGGKLKNVHSLLTSSGHSGVFSLSVNTYDDIKYTPRAIDTVLQQLFDIDKKKTLILNALPMGVKVYTEACMLAETSVREDMIWALIQKFKMEVDQFILLAEGSFAKKVIEDGAAQKGINWSHININIITGEEGISENYRTYMAAQIGVKKENIYKGNKLIGSSMGAAELGLNLFHETRESIKIRRLAHENKAFRKALFGDDGVCPMLFVYYPHKHFVEELKQEGVYYELAVSQLDDTALIPLIRYKTGDFGKILSRDFVADTLKQFEYEVDVSSPLPFVAVSGRTKGVKIPKGTLYPEQIKEALYSHVDIAKAITGNFQISQQGKNAQLEIQLKQSEKLTDSSIKILTKAIKTYSKLDVNVVCHSYENCPFGMNIDYERKFKYVL